MCADQLLDELEREQGLQLSAEHADTLAGWVLEHLHRLAVPGDEVRADGVVARVLEVDGARITSIALHAERFRDEDEDDDAVAEPTPEDAPAQGSRS
jgi:CBS domain containing-hemolysin-like protein